MLTKEAFNRASKVQVHGIANAALRVRERRTFQILDRASLGNHFRIVMFLQIVRLTFVFASKVNLASKDTLVLRNWSRKVGCVRRTQVRIFFSSNHTLESSAVASTTSKLEHGGKGGQKIANKGEKGA